ncbi:MAG: 50S ribosomal protein L18 [Christensenellaceae bacterium]|jgi:large subunit ribosomal protein L18|nr:50S ribosomal protein L18 [Christensenellaceae bacterium]
MLIKDDKNKARLKRAKRQSDIRGTAKCPRLCVYRSLSHIYAQLIDDEKGETMLAVNTLMPEIMKLIKGKTKKESAEIVGVELAKAATAKKIKEVVFDRNGYVYTGRVASVADGARKGGLKF